jgi:hypothetical protein
MTKSKDLEKKIAVIKEIASTITSANSLDAVTNLILDLAIDYSNAVSGSILLLDDRGDLVIEASRGITPSVADTVRVKVGEFICGKVAEEKTPLLVKDAGKLGKFKGRRIHKYKGKSFICCPILMKDRLIGVININSRADNCSFSDDDLDLIEILATQAAIAIEYSRLFSELRAKTIDLDDRNKTLIDNDRMKTEFIARMSHELRTPLNSIKGAVYYLQQKQPSLFEQKEFIGIISDETDKLIALMTDMLNFPEFEQREQQLQKRLLNMNEVIDEALGARAVRETFSAKSVEARKSAARNAPYLAGEKIRLIQCMMHLFAGLASYAERGDRLQIKVEGSRAGVRIDLVIRRRQLPENELYLMFDDRALWYSMDVDRKRMKFCLAKKTIELHNGRIEASNTPAGIRVRIYFPKNEKDFLEAKTNEIIRLFIPFVSETMKLRRCSFMMSDESGETLSIRGAIGIIDEVIQTAKVRTGEEISGKTFESGDAILVKNIEKDARFSRKNSSAYITGSFISVPVFLLNCPVGVLNMNDPYGGRPFNEKDLLMAKAIARKISSMLRRVLSEDFPVHEFDNLSRNMESLIDAERNYQKNGIAASLVYKIMKKLDRPEDEISEALFSSRIYDIGMTQIDSNILMKPGRLSELERKIVRTHPFPGAKLINAIETDNYIKEAVLFHHEKYDGTGYPSGLRGDQIPFISRVISVVDSFTAMTTDRPYRKSFSRKEALNEIIAGAGTVYDPDIVTAFKAIV